MKPPHFVDLDDLVVVELTPTTHVYGHDLRTPDDASPFPLNARSATSYRDALLARRGYLNYLDVLQRAEVVA